MRLLPTDFPRLTALPLALAALALAPGASAQMGKGAAGEPACHAVGVDGAPAPGACRVLVPSAFVAWPVSGGLWLSTLVGDGDGDRGAALIGLAADTAPVVSQVGAADLFIAARVAPGVGLGWTGGIRPVGQADGGVFGGVAVGAYPSMRLSVRGGVAGHTSPGGRSAGPAVEGSLRAGVLDIEGGRTFGIGGIGAGMTRGAVHVLVPVRATSSLASAGAGVTVMRVDGTGRAMVALSGRVAF